VIVGAGPTGLLLAGELERRDVPCLLVDSLDAPQSWDRATIVHARSLEIFEALGLVDAFLRVGVQVGEARFRSGGETIGVLDLSKTGSRYGFDLGISEEVTESVLLGDLARHGGGVTRSTRVVGLRQDGEVVVASLELDGEASEVTAPWLVGCDGVHSRVRALAGLGFPGTDVEPEWAVFDATLDGWDEEFDVAFAHLDVPPVILTPLPDHRWRVYLRPTSSTSDLVADAARVVNRYKPQVEFRAVENPARFRCHSRVASSFRSGRVLLAGDAAHACSPAEGHGMNTGLQDAFNLGWKLALVCRGVAGDGLLDTYELERRPVAVRVVESGQAVEEGQALTGAADREERDAAIREAYGDPDAAHHEAVGAAEIDRSYADSPIVVGDGGEGATLGRLLPDTPPVHPADGPARSLHELAHRPDHTLLMLGGERAEPGDVGRLAAALREAYGDSPVVGAVHALSVGGGGEGIGTMDEAVADQLGVKDVTVLAVRPDRYVGFRHDGGDPGAFQTYLDALLSARVASGGG
jgi:2-polyprenyl-6-methoxyphenol hydroxylase-like FAD-dependent oxidoreductase